MKQSESILKMVLICVKILLIHISLQFTSVLEQMKKQESNSGLVNNEMSSLNAHLINLKQVLLIFVIPGQGHIMAGEFDND